MEDVEHFDLSVCYGFLVDTVPSTSWALYYIYSQKSLLNEPKESISPHVRVSTDTSGILRRRVNIAEIIEGTPPLPSTVQETLRMQSTNESGRVVLRDTLLEDQYLLTKDSILLVPSAGLHNNASVWVLLVKISSRAVSYRGEPTEQRHRLRPIRFIGVKPRYAQGVSLP